jgi:hypothetical protein
MSTLVLCDVNMLRRFALSLVVCFASVRSLASCEPPSPAPCHADAPATLASLGVLPSITWQDGGGFLAAALATDAPAADSGAARRTVTVSRVDVNGAIAWQRSLMVPTSLADAETAQQVKAAAVNGGVVVAWVVKTKTGAHLHAQYLSEEGPAPTEFVLAESTCDPCAMAVQLAATPQNAAILYRQVDETGRSQSFLATFSENRVVTNRAWPAQSAPPSVTDGGLGGILPGGSLGGGESPSGPQLLQVVGGLFAVWSARHTTLYDADLHYVAGPFPVVPAMLSWAPAAQLAAGVTSATGDPNPGQFPAIEFLRWTRTGSALAQSRISVGVARTMARREGRYATLLMDEVPYLALTDEAGSKIGADTPIPLARGEVLDVRYPSLLNAHTDGFLRIGYDVDARLVRQEVHCAP